jgi:hypothetical protein
VLEHFQVVRAGFPGAVVAGCCAWLRGSRANTAATMLTLVAGIMVNGDLIDSQEGILEFE